MSSRGVLHGIASLAAIWLAGASPAFGAAECRAALDAARGAVLEKSAEAPGLLAEARRRVAELPASAPDRSALELHVLRSRMLSGERGEGIEAELARLAEVSAPVGEAGIGAFAHRYLAELAFERGDRGLARAELDRVLLGPESDATWEARVEADLFRERFLIGDAGTGRDGVEASRVLRRASDLLARLRPRLDEAVFLEAARPVHERLVRRLLDVDRPDEATLREVLSLLEALKVAELRAYFGDPCLADLETTTPERLPGTLLVYPVVLEDRVELIVGSGGRLERRRAPIDPATLVAESRKLRGALQDPTSVRHRSIAAGLYDALIRPLSPELERLEGDDATLVFVPSGSLRELPIAALYDAKTGRHLIEQIAVATLPSLHVLPQRALDPRRTRVLVAGLTQAVEDLPALRFAARELETAAGRFPATRRIDADFTRDAFAAAFDERPFDVVHVASHGRFDARASESFLLARDGRIGFADLADWIGRTRLRTGRPLELLVLSACETAIGDERAVLGLAGVAVQAGARSAIASLWKVHDEATMELFRGFYAELGRPGVSRAEALRRAQRTLLAESRFRHPVFWSAFVLVNGWR